MDSVAAMVEVEDLAVGVGVGAFGALVVVGQRAVGADRMRRVVAVVEDRALGPRVVAATTKPCRRLIAARSCRRVRGRP